MSVLWSIQNIEKVEYCHKLMGYISQGVRINSN